MVAPVVLLDIVRTVRTRTLLRHFADRSQARCFLRFLIPLLAAGRSILVFLARLAFVPRVFVHDAGFSAAGGAGEDIAFLAA